MSDLSREQIEQLRAATLSQSSSPRERAGIGALFDMALRTHDAEQRAQRAEAECEWLREALKMARPFVKSWMGSRNNQAADEAAEVDKAIASALATPPPEGEYSIRCVICDASVRPEDGGLCDKHKYDEQAHGDALAAKLDRISKANPGNIDGAPESVAVYREWWQFIQEAAAEARQALTASGVPYVPEEVRRLPDTLRALIPQQTSGIAQAAFEMSAVRAERALASAPADGWKLVPVEPTEAMIEAADAADDEYTERQFGPGVQRMQLSGYDHWMAMIAAAPTDGRE